MTYQRDLQFITDLIYYGLTTSLGSQTLGEEYCDLIQVSGRRSPGWLKRLQLISLAVVFPFFLDKYQAFILKQVRRIITWDQNQISVLTVIGIINKVHLAVFYLKGKERCESI